MKSTQSPPWLRLVTRFLSFFTCLAPSFLLAHPGHYHPDETDEFDFFRATFLHSHGTLDFVLIGLAITSLVIVLFAGRPGLRVGAIAVGLVSLVLLPIL